MDKLFKTFAKLLPVIVWLVLAIASLTLLFQNNPYHRSIWFSSASRVVGTVYDIRSNVTGYFGLRETNEAQLVRIGCLTEENLRLRQQLQVYQDQIDLALDTTAQNYNYMIAHVVGNSVNQADNYITIDKGLLDGVEPDLGVVDQNGVVGLVAKVSNHYSLVLSVLNSKFALSVKLKNNQQNASLKWDGQDARYALLTDLPRNVNPAEGDTVVTTGFTSTFPKDVPVGTIAELSDQGGSFLSIKVELFADFNRLNDVHVIFDKSVEERRLLEKP